MKLLELVRCIIRKSIQLDISNNVFFSQIFFRADAGVYTRRMQHVHCDATAGHSIAIWPSCQCSGDIQIKSRGHRAWTTNPALPGHWTEHWRFRRDDCQHSGQGLRQIIVHSVWIFNCFNSWTNWTITQSMRFVIGINVWLLHRPAAGVMLTYENGQHDL